MLVVISDLHFEEEASTHIPGDADTHLNRNLPARPFLLLMNQLANAAERNDAQRLDFVLAGDIFDINRTALWHTDNPTGVRPYVSTAEISAELEAMILKILDAISAEPNVQDSLAVIQRLAGGRYLDLDGDTPTEKPFPVAVTVHYIPGNHDRMANATARIRRKIRDLLGMPTSATPFPYVVEIEPEQVLVRHGHEYDYANFAYDHRNSAEIPTHLPIDQYQAAPVGDFVTVDVASALPPIYRQTYGDERIRADKTLKDLYMRLIEFDDVRPTSALFNYFMYADPANVAPEEAWEVIEPVLLTLIDRIYDDPFLDEWLDKLDKKFAPDAIDAIQAALFLKPWRWTNSIPFALVQGIANRAINAHTERPGPETYAIREVSIQDGSNRFLIAGHTHHPAVELVAHDAGGERYYIDTGTWRNQVPATPDFMQYGRLKALTHVVVYNEKEARGIRPSAETAIASFDFVTGVTQGWDRGESGVEAILPS